MYIIIIMHSCVNCCHPWPNSNTIKYNQMLLLLVVGIYRCVYVHVCVRRCVCVCVCVCCFGGVDVYI